MNSDRIIKPELTRIVWTLLLSKFVAFRRRMTSSIRGCVHSPRFGCGVEGAPSPLRGVVLRMGSALPMIDRLVDVCDVVASAVDDIFSSLSPGSCGG